MAENQLVVVAIPRDDDYVWKVSSEKVPHMTLLYLGQGGDDVLTAHCVQYIEHASSLLHRAWMSVDRRGKLGADDADVLFFDKGNTNYQMFNDFRSNLLQDSAISTAYQSTTQFPEWTPHLTLGFPEKPAKKDPRDYGFNGVEFDKIALWTGDSEGPTFQLKTFDAQELAVASMSDDFHGENLDDVLEHYGVVGMKWGKRRARVVGARSSEHLAVRAIRDKKKSTHLSSLTNQELQTAITRLNLEKQFTQLNPSKKKVVQGVIKGVLGVGKTANEFAAFQNSPTAQAIRNNRSKS